MQSLQDGEAYSKFDVNQFAINKLVCDPMGGEVGTQDLVEGLHAKLWHLTADQPHYNKVQDYFDYGHPSNQDIFFSEVNVPTRIFSEGFPTLVGDTIKTDDGQNLVEYFAMEFDGGLRLGPDDPEGEYELAEKHFADAVRFGPDNAKVRNSFGLLQYKFRSGSFNE